MKKLLMILAVLFVFGVAGCSEEVLEPNEQELEAPMDPDPDCKDNGQQGQDCP